MCVVTDGGDNSSSRASMVTMRQAIEAKKARGWNIVMIGMNSYDTARVSEQYGIGRGATLDAGQTPEAIRNTFAAVSGGVSPSPMPSGAPLVGTSGAGARRQATKPPRRPRQHRT